MSQPRGRTMPGCISAFGPRAPSLNLKPRSKCFLLESNNVPSTPCVATYCTIIISPSWQRVPFAFALSVIRMTTPPSPVQSCFSRFEYGNLSISSVVSLLLLTSLLLLLSIFTVLLVSSSSVSSQSLALYYYKQMW